eukprot:3086600-Prymnesium_polylepis.1
MQPDRFSVVCSSVWTLVHAHRARFMIHGWLFDVRTRPALGGRGMGSALASAVLMLRRVACAVPVCAVAAPDARTAYGNLQHGTAAQATALGFTSFFILS